MCLVAEWVAGYHFMVAMHVWNEKGEDKQQ
jgi:hypothetical protein